MGNQLDNNCCYRSDDKKKGQFPPENKPTKFKSFDDTNGSIV